MYYRHELQASQFVSSPNPLILLGDASRLIFDTTDLDDNVHTTMEVRECAKDVKVCGPGEIRALLNWRKKVIADIAAVKRAEFSLIKHDYINIISALEYERAREKLKKLKLMRLMLN